MIRWLLPLCATLWGTALLPPLGAQSGSPPNRVSYDVHEHTDELAVAPAPPQVLEGALTALAAELRKVKLKSGTLDVEGLIAAIRPGLQEIKSPERLKLTSLASCNVVDPQDLGGYWSGPALFFVGGGKDYTVEALGW